MICETRSLEWCTPQGVQGILGEAVWSSTMVEAMAALLGGTGL